MDADERRTTAEEITRAREAQGLSAAALARKAGISENTMSRVTNGLSVHPGTLHRLRQVLGIEPLAETIEREGYPEDVELIRNAIGFWLRDLDPQRRAEMIAKIFRAAADRDD